MDFKTLIKDKPFCVIGKEIYTWDGDGLIPKVWAVVESKFTEIEPLILKDEAGKPLAKWGAMSSKKRDFSMWEENGSVGLYLAGYEAPLEVEAPAGWTKWIVPAFEYRLGKIEGDGYFYRAFSELENQGMRPVAATENWFDPETGGAYFAFPVKWL